MKCHVAVFYKKRTRKKQKEIEENFSFHLESHRFPAKLSFIMSSETWLSTAGCPVPR